MTTPEHLEELRRDYLTFAGAVAGAFVELVTASTFEHAEAQAAFLAAVSGDANEAARRLREYATLHVGTDWFDHLIGDE